MALSAQLYKDAPLFIGENELIDDQYVLRNPTADIEEKHSTARIVSLQKDYRQQ